MSRTSSLLLGLALTLPACAEDASDPSPGELSPEAGGKSDDVEGEGESASDPADEGTCPEGRTCLDYQSYEVLFTNPVCGNYRYDEPIEEVDGERDVLGKPKNVYCTKEFDSVPSGSRRSSPQRRLLDWIEPIGAGDELFLAYLSFSDGKIADALCDAEARGAEVTFVLDKMSSKAEQVLECGVDVLIRGHQGSVGFAHDKILMVNPKAAGPADGDETTYLKLSFGSGNMSSGTHLHHENWHFLEVNRDSYFVQTHLCLMESLLDEAHTDGKGAYRSFMNECRDAIAQPPEDDIIPYFIPVLDDSRALTAKMLELIDAAETIDIGAHRFSYNELIDALSARLSSSRPFHLRFIADDDLYWLDPIAPARIAVLGPNSFHERDKVRELREADGGAGRFEEKYLETNHSLHLLHHNKYLLARGLEGRDALIVGSSNFTGTGFEGNLENMYFVDIPEVVDAFKAQFALMWDGEGPLPEGLDVPPMATFRDDMPVELVTVKEPSAVEEPVDRSADGRTCGIRIAEVVYDVDGSDTGREWIKLYNSCDDERSLEGMSLGWGGSTYGTGGIDLNGSVAGKSCLIVGGPDASVTVDLELAWTPDIQNSGSEADGIALFAAEQSEADDLPVDAVVYGSSNVNGLIDHTGEAAQPHVGDAAAGEAIVRIDEDTWAIDQPDALACPSF